MMILTMVLIVTMITKMTITMTIFLVPRLAMGGARPMGGLRISPKNG
jgi:hypothetical protein